MDQNRVRTRRASHAEAQTDSAAAVLPEEQDTSSSLGWKLLRMDTNQGQTLKDRKRS